MLVDGGEPRERNDRVAALGRDEELGVPQRAVLLLCARGGLEMRHAVGWRRSVWGDIKYK